MILELSMAAAVLVAIFAFLLWQGKLAWQTVVFSFLVTCGLFLLLLLTDIPEVLFSVFGVPAALAICMIFDAKLKTWLDQK